MRYVSIDIETTGLDPKRHQIIEFAAVIENTKKEKSIEELSHFNCVMEHKDQLWDESTLLFHNSRIFDILKNEEKIQPYQLAPKFAKFLTDNNFERTSPIRITVAGKSFASFDMRFLEEIQNWKEIIHVSHKILDPTLFFLRKNDDDAPGLGTCLQRMGIEKEVQHRALDDARDVIRLIRYGMKNNGKK